MFNLDVENLNDMNVVFDAREVESYQSLPSEDYDEEEEFVTVRFKSGKEMNLHMKLDQKLYPGDNLITAIDMVQYSHFWHDNEDSTPDEDED